MKTVLLAGRLNGPKGEVALRIIESVFIPLAGHTRTRFLIAGGPVEERHRELQRLHTALEFTGFRGDIQNLYSEADVVVGAGRVALEAMAAGRPVLAIGHHTYCGPALKKNERRILETNAGDFAHEKNHDFAALKSDLEKLLSDPALLRRISAEGRAIAEAHFKTARIAEQVGERYRAAMLAVNRQRLDEVRIVFAESEIRRNEQAILPSSLGAARLPENPALLCAIGATGECSQPHVLFLSGQHLQAPGHTPPRETREIGLAVEDFSELKGTRHRLLESLKRIAPWQRCFPLLVLNQAAASIPDFVDRDFFPVVRLNEKKLYEIVT